ncbi:hypothetical protein FHX74_002493 [Friedmanniella endophytica]|uniref:Uncharacterized protein n=1 Tax=Microlunatus kandeliicorticis TaxID=1759536 RepID=A0A7W3P6F8_9ACTN|nr:hypothetical protein [Microlunatus kandeliicorticis]MBA8794865.1 hypothetical protein [Microlunatus kandeliicorticis]
MADDQDQPTEGDEQTTGDRPETTDGGALDRAQEAIDDARSAVPDALPSDPLEGVSQEDERLTAGEQAAAEEDPA